MPFALEELEDFEGLRGSGVSEIERRLINAGYVFEPSRAGKHFWVQPRRRVVAWQRPAGRVWR